MQISLDQSAGALLVRRYDGDAIWIGEQRHTRPVLLTRTRVADDWAATSLSTLSVDQLAPIFLAGAPVVIMGSRGPDRIAPADVRAAFRERRIALETMELGAACRTYNVLVQEGREVLAALFP